MMTVEEIKRRFIDNETDLGQFINEMRAIGQKPKQISKAFGEMWDIFMSDDQEKVI